MARLGLGALGAALGLYAIGLAIWEPGALTLPVAVHVLVGWSFVAAGLVAWRERPENRLGLLLTLTGIVWFGRDFDWFGSWTANHASELSQNLFLALLAHQILVFPPGVPPSRLDRLLAVAFYLLAVLAARPRPAAHAATPALSALRSATCAPLARAARPATTTRWSPRPKRRVERFARSGRCRTSPS